MSADVARVVLDTNACLDLFVFDDPGVQALRMALHSGQVVAITDHACRDEWLRVLEYPKLHLDDAARAAAVGAFDALVQPLQAAPDAALPQSGSLGAPAHAAGHAEQPALDGSAADGAPRLPRCRDPDDQKFLELALAIGARWLVSRDAHVLALGRRTRREGWFEIVTPQAWRLE